MIIRDIIMTNKHITSYLIPNFKNYIKKQFLKFLTLKQKSNDKLSLTIGTKQNFLHNQTNLITFSEQKATKHSLCFFFI